MKYFTKIFTFMILTICFTNAFILPNDGGFDLTGLPIFQKQVSARQPAYNQYMGGYGDSMQPVQQSYGVSKPQPDSYANWYLNNYAMMGL